MEIFESLRTEGPWAYGITSLRPSIAWFRSCILFLSRLLTLSLRSCISSLLSSDLLLAFPPPPQCSILHWLASLLCRFSRQYFWNILLEKKLPAESSTTRSGDEERLQVEPASESILTENSQKKKKKFNSNPES